SDFRRKILKRGQKGRIRRRAIRFIGSAKKAHATCDELIIFEQIPEILEQRIQLSSGIEALVALLDFVKNLGLSEKIFGEHGNNRLQIRIRKLVIERFD